MLGYEVHVLAVAQALGIGLLAEHHHGDIGFVCPGAVFAELDAQRDQPLLDPGGPVLFDRHHKRVAG